MKKILLECMINGIVIQCNSLGLHYHWILKKPTSKHKTELGKYIIISVKLESVMRRKFTRISIKRNLLKK